MATPLPQCDSKGNSMQNTRSQGSQDVPPEEQELPPPPQHNGDMVCCLQTLLEEPVLVGKHPDLTFMSFWSRLS